MKLSTIIAPLMLVAAVSSAPLEPSEVKLALRDYDATVNKVRASSKAAGCKWVACVKSLARYNSICALAAAHAGLNIPLDIACITSVRYNLPPACKRCRR